MELAHAAVAAVDEAVPRVQSLVDNVSELITEGGLQVAERVMEGTDKLVDAAKPKVKHSLRTIAWQVRGI